MELAALFVQPDPPTPALLATNVSRCLFTYQTLNQLNAMITLELGLTKGGEWIEVAVADTGSFTRAAQALQLPTSGVDPSVTSKITVEANFDSRLATTAPAAAVTPVSPAVSPSTTPPSRGDRGPWPTTRTNGMSAPAR